MHLVGRLSEISVKKLCQNLENSIVWSLGIGTSLAYRVFHGLGEFARFEHVPAL
jgi:hypothetical protein